MTTVSQTLLWTVCPAGKWPDGRPKISLFLAPRLDVTALGEDVPLSTVGGDFRRWSNVVKTLDWSEWALAVSRNEGHYDELQLEVRSPDPDPRFWGRIFPPDCPVRTWRASDTWQKPVVTYDARLAEAGRLALWTAMVVRALARTRSQAQGGSIEALRRMPDLDGAGAGTLSALGALGDLLEEGPAFRARLLRTLIEVFRFGRDRTRTLPAEVEETAARLQAVGPALGGFLTALAFGTHIDHVGAPGTPDFEFHERLAMLGDHPTLLRKLGLVVDFAVHGPALPANGSFAAWVKPSWSPRAPTTQPEVRTWCRRLIDGRWEALPAPTDDLHQGGFLRLDDSDRFQVMQVDVPMAAQETAGAARSADPDTLPAPPRTLGPTLYQKSRGAHVARRLLRGEEVRQQLASGEGVELYAGDLIRGYRYDIRDEDEPGQPWRSLCRRRGAYVDSRTNAAMAKADEEGIVREAIRGQEGLPEGAEPGEEIDALFVDERLVTWDGWSLAVARPGRPVDVDGELAPAEPVVDARFRLRAQFSVPPRSLPRLRYGHRYRFRARTVDLAGNSVDPDATNAAHASNSLLWRRQEDVGPAVAIAHAPAGPGESRKTVVLRSTKGTADPPGEARLWFAPPRSTPDVCDHHGLFDPAWDADDVARSEAMREAWATIAKREEPLPESVEPDRGVRLDRYLADPLARDLELHAADPSAPLPGGADVWSGPFYAPGATWPQTRAIRVELRAGRRSSASWDAKHGALVVTLPPGTSARYTFRTPIPPEAQTITPWARPSPQGNARHSHDVARPDIYDILEMLVPPGDLTLRHATMRPVRIPAVQGLQLTRAPGDTTVDLDGVWRLHRPSTGSVALRAAWSEVIDDPDSPRGYRVERRDVEAFGTDVVEFADRDSVGFPEALHELGDTKHRRIQYRGRATSRFVDCFSETDPSKFVVDGRPVAASVPSSARPAAPRIVMVVPTFAWTRAARGERRTSRRQGGLRVYLDGPWFSSGAGERLAVLLSVDGSPSPELAPLVSRWGADPLRLVGAEGDIDGTAPLRLRRFPEPFNDLPARSSVVHGLALVESSESVVAWTHGVAFDPDRRRWYADVVFDDLDEAAWPFVRLALARYQPESLPGLELSEVAVAGFAQPAPERTLTTIRAGGTYDVVLSSASPGAVDPIAAVHVRVQKQMPSRGELGWVDDPAAANIVAQSVSGSILWRGSITPTAASAGERLRVVVEEQSTLPSASTEGVDGRRLLFVEHVALW